MAAAVQRALWGLRATDLLLRFERKNAGRPDQWTSALSVLLCCGSERSSEEKHASRHRLVGPKKGPCEGGLGRGHSPPRRNVRQPRLPASQVGAIGFKGRAEMSTPESGSSNLLDAFFPATETAEEVEVDEVDGEGDEEAVVAKARRSVPPPAPSKRGKRSAAPPLRG